MAIIVQLEERLGCLEKRIAELEAELAKSRKDSSTSSKLPSSDVVKPPKPKPKGRKKRRKTGGQPGHTRHKREPFAEQAIRFEVIGASPKGREAKPVANGPNGSGR